MSEPTSKPILVGKSGWTYPDYLKLPEDGKRYEILDGELSVSPSPTPRHQLVSRQIARRLFDSLLESGEGEVFYAPLDVVLSADNVLQPDLIFIRRENTQIIGAKSIEGPPDLVVEVLSPATRRKDRARKSAVYARFGVPHFWIADPESRCLELYWLDGETYQLAASGQGTEVLAAPGFPGLKLDLREIFK